MSNKGYSSQQKLERLGGQYSTVEPVRLQQWAQSVLGHIFVRSVGTDAAEADSTTSVINATAHAAHVGDIIRFTSGNLSGNEYKVSAVAANTITLSENLSEAPATLDAFQILRHKYPIVDSDGNIAVSVVQEPVKFVLNGVDTEVSKDTVTASNSRPLPVQLLKSDGNLTTTDFATETTLAAMSAKLPATLGQKLKAASLAVVLASDSDTLPVSGPLTDAQLRATAVPVSGPLTDVELRASAVPVSLASVPLASGAATEAKQDTGNTSLASIDSKLTSPLTVQATNLDIRDLTSASDSVASVQSGSWSVTANAGTNLNTSALALESGGNLDAIAASASVLDDWDESNRAAVNTISGQVGVQGGSGAVSANTQRVCLATDVALPAGSNLLGKVDVNLNTVDFLDTPLLDASSTNVPASSASTLEVVASTASATKKIQVSSTIGSFIGVYVGAGNGTLTAIIGPGQNHFIEVLIAASSRISVRNMENTTISAGLLTLVFLG